MEALRSGTITVGLLYRGPLRRFLQEQQFNGQVGEWTEVRSLLRSKFLIKGLSEKAWRSIVVWSHPEAAQGFNLIDQQRRAKSPFLGLSTLTPVPDRKE